MSNQAYWRGQNQRAANGDGAAQRMLALNYAVGDADVVAMLDQGPDNWDWRRAVNNLPPSDFANERARRGRARPKSPPREGKYWEQKRDRQAEQRMNWQAQQNYLQQTIKQQPQVPQYQGYGQQNPYQPSRQQHSQRPGQQNPYQPPAQAPPSQQSSQPKPSAQSVTPQGMRPNPYAQPTAPQGMQPNPYAQRSAPVSGSRASPAAPSGAMAPAPVNTGQASQQRQQRQPGPIGPSYVAHLARLAGEKDQQAYSSLRTLADNGNPDAVKALLVLDLAHEKNIWKYSRNDDSRRRDDRGGRSGQGQGVV